MAENAEVVEPNNENPADFAETKDGLKVPISEIVVLRTDQTTDSNQIEGYYIGQKSANELSPSADLSFKRAEFQRPAPGLLSKVTFQNLPSHLCVSPQNGGNNIHFVVSILSGTRKAQPFFESAVKPLTEALGIKDFDVHNTTSEHTVSELTKSIFLPRANQHVEQTIILLSGDGGLVDIVNAILSPSLKSDAVLPSIVLLPMGTGNALAHSSGLTQDSTLGLRRMVMGSPRALPMFHVNFSPGSMLVTDEGRVKVPLQIPTDNATHNPAIYGAVVCSWGLHASLVADSDTSEYRKYGVDRFAMAAKELLDPADGSESHRYRAKVTLFRKGDQGKLIRYRLQRSEHMYILLTLVSNLQQGFTISPMSSPLDGQLRLVHFGYMESAEVMRILGLAYNGGRHVQDAAVGYEAVEGVRLEFQELEERWRQVCVDGKIIAVDEDGWIEVHKAENSCVKLVI